MTLPSLNPIPPQPASQPDLPKFQVGVRQDLGGPNLLVYRTAALSIANGFVFTAVPFDTLENPTASAPYYNRTTGVFSVPRAGLWWVNAFVMYNIGTAFTAALEALKNGATGYRLGTLPAAAANTGVWGNRLIPCVLGDTLLIRTAQSSATNPGPLFVGNTLCYASFVFWAPLG